MPVDINLIIVIVLIVLAIVDLTVGVANDAVNFLNSAIGSKAAPFRIILLVAAIGVLVGVTLSGGMMEIARSGIFNPQFFIVGELLIIFVAVMFQDIFLLDLFNTFGLPTSTTVSVIFGLLGSSLALSVIKVLEKGMNLGDAIMYLNSDKVLEIVSAILFSIVIAFIAGAFFQYLTRFLFTFGYKEKFRKFGSIWAGLALTCLTFFIMLKGIKGASFMTPELADTIKQNTIYILTASFVLWTIILQLLIMFTKINVLKIIVLFGTFSLALAFAANDLVNFIGAPLAGLHAYQYAYSTPNPASADMSVLNTPVMAETWMLLIAGLVMVSTLFFSKKAHGVALTTIRLSRQNEGYERFDSNVLARAIVRIVLIFFTFVKKITPLFIQRVFQERFDSSKYQPEETKDNDAPAFDLLRAAVILMVSAGLISLATFAKLPLSTTYVTFIVAMAAALPDKAWGRESAVYRVSGVITVIGGWFFTALSASMVAGTIALLLYYGGAWTLGGFVALAAITLYRTAVVHKGREKEFNEKDKMIQRQEKLLQSKLDMICEDMLSYVMNSSKTVRKVFSGIEKKDYKKLKTASKRADKINIEGNILCSEILKFLQLVHENEIEERQQYIRSLAYITELSDRMINMSSMTFNYFDNSHEPFIKYQLEEIHQIAEKYNYIDDSIHKIISEKEYHLLETLDELNSEMNKMVLKFKKNQLIRVKKNQANMRRSMLYLTLLNDVQIITNQKVLICKICKNIHQPDIIKN